MIISLFIYGTIREITVPFVVWILGKCIKFFYQKMKILFNKTRRKVLMSFCILIYEGANSVAIVVSFKSNVMINDDMRNFPLHHVHTHLN